MPSRISQMRNGINPLLQQETQPNSIQQARSSQINDEYINQIKTIMHSNNPKQLLTQMVAQNPQVQQMFQLIQNGRNPQALAQMMAQQRGIDLNALMQKLMS